MDKATGTELEQSVLEPNRNQNRFVDSKIGIETVKIS